MEYHKHMEQKLQKLWEELEAAKDKALGEVLLNNGSTRYIVDEANAIGFAQGLIRAYEIMTGSEE